MAKGPTFGSIISGFASASQLNANNAATATAFENTVSRDGSTPNTMGADFDMNGWDILNTGTLEVDTLTVNNVPFDPAQSAIDAAASAVDAAADAAAAAASAASIDNKIAYDDVAEATAATVPSTINILKTAGYFAFGDGGGQYYKRVAVEPTHNLKINSADGAWWDLMPHDNGINALAAGVLIDGTTDNITAIESLDAHGNERIKIAEGIAVTSALPATLGTRFEGEGQLQVNGQVRGRMFSYIDSEQTRGGQIGWTDQFDGDNKMSPIQIDVQYESTVSDPFGAEGVIFETRNEIIPVMAQLRIGADVGFNINVDQNGPGRSGAYVFRSKVSHGGQGDAVCYNAEAFVDSTKAGATHWLASPAVALYNGNVVGGAAGVYLQGMEFHLSSGAFDNAGVGNVTALTRDVASSALDTYWAGVRLQSQGSQSIDEGFMTSGPFDISFNAVRMTTGDAALAMKTGHRIYLDSSLNGTLLTTLGNSHIGHSGGGIVSTVGSIAISNLTSTQLQLTPAGGSSAMFTAGTAGGSQFATVGQTGSFAFFGALSSAADSMGVVIRTTVAGAEVNTLTLSSGGNLDLTPATAEYRIAGTKVLDARITGWGIPTGAATRTTFVTSTVTLPQLAERVKALIDDLTVHGMIGA